MTRKRSKLVQKASKIFYSSYFTFTVILMQRMGLVSSIFKTDIFGNSAPKLPNCQKSTVNGDVTAICGADLDFNHYRYEIPLSLPTNLQVLNLSAASWMTESTFTFRAQDFTHYAHLHTILLRKNYIMHWGLKSSGKRVDVLNHKIYEHIFENILTLKHLEFSDSYLGDNWQVTLPRNLKTLKIDKNEYTILDVHWCPDIEEINANENQLISMPTLHQPLPPLKILRLKQNPLDNMKILDLAPLCHLQELQLEFPKDSYFTKNIEKNYCECDALISWVKKANITGVETVTCSKPNDEERIDCSKYTKNTIEEADKVRGKCLAAEVAARAASKSFFVNIWMYIAYGIVMLLLIIAVLAFILWQSNWWGGIDEQPSRSSSLAADEDDEEEPGSSSLVEKSDSRYS